MSQRFVAVQWNRRKLAYDLVLIIAVVGYYFGFQLVANLSIDDAQRPNVAILKMRSLGSAAFLLISFVLAIGPLARIWPQRFKPLLYNRRHLGVLLFLIGLMHAREVLGFYQAYGRLSPLGALFHYDSSFSGAAIPFQFFGLAALSIFGVMALCSHDFWQKILGPRCWKSLHMTVYLAYLAIVAHVALGAVADQGWSGHSLVYALVALGVTGLQLTAGLREWRRSRGRPDAGNHFDAGSLSAIMAKSVTSILHPDGRRLALLQQKGEISAVEAQCAHQGGPLDEGQIIDGCLTCPWHGWQYRCGDGKSPPPFSEAVPTYQVTLAAGQVQIATRCAPMDQPAQPLVLPDTNESELTANEDFFVGYLPMTPSTARRSLKTAAAAVLLFLVLGVTLAATQKTGGSQLRPWQPGQSFEGLLLAEPYPQLRYLNEDGAIATLFLVAGGKSSTSLPPEFIGTSVRVTGLLLQRGQSRMLAGPEIRALELAPSGLQKLHDSVPIHRNEQTVIGEVVDAKCFLGAMRPGQGQTHRACAQICIEGGIPAFLAVFSDSGPEQHFLLTDRDGKPVNAEILPYVAESVAITGEVVESAGVLILKFEIGSITRL